MTVPCKLPTFTKGLSPYVLAIALYSFLMYPTLSWAMPLSIESEQEEGRSPLTKPQSFEEMKILIEGNQHSEYARPLEAKGDEEAKRGGAYAAQALINVGSHLISWANGKPLLGLLASSTLLSFVGGTTVSLEGCDILRKGCGDFSCVEDTNCCQFAEYNVTSPGPVRVRISMNNQDGTVIHSTTGCTPFVRYTITSSFFGYEANCSSAVDVNALFSHTSGPGVCYIPSSDFSGKTRATLFFTGDTEPLVVPPDIYVQPTPDVPEWIQPLSIDASGTGTVEGQYLPTSQLVIGGSHAPLSALDVDNPENAFIGNYTLFIDDSDMTCSVRTVQTHQFTQADVDAEQVTCTLHSDNPIGMIDACDPTNRCAGRRNITFIGVPGYKPHAPIWMVDPEIDATGTGITQGEFLPTSWLPVGPFSLSDVDNPEDTFEGYYKVSGINGIEFFNSDNARVTTFTKEDVDSLSIGCIVTSENPAAEIVACDWGDLCSVSKRFTFRGVPQEEPVEFSTNDSMAETVVGYIASGLGVIASIYGVTAGALYKKRINNYKFEHNVCKRLRLNTWAFKNIRFCGFNISGSKGKKFIEAIKSVKDALKTKGTSISILDHSDMKNMAQAFVDAINEKSEHIFGPSSWWGKFCFMRRRNISAEGYQYIKDNADDIAQQAMALYSGTSAVELESPTKK